MRAGPSSPGLVDLSLITNEHAAILVKFTTSHRHGRLRVEWNTVDLLHGRREHTTDSASITSSTMNFVQDHGLRSGSNTLASSSSATAMRVFAR